MDGQNISNIKTLLQLPIALRAEELTAIQTGSFEDIHHVLYSIQERLPENIHLDIDNLTADAATLYPGVPLDGQEQFEAEQRQQESLGFGDAATLAAVPLTFQKTSKEQELANTYDVLKKDEVNKTIADITATKDGAERQKKVRALLESLQRETLYEDRKNKLLEQVKEANHKNGEELSARIQKRHEELQQDRRRPVERKGLGRTTTPTASNENYNAYLDRLMGTLDGFSDERLEKFLKSYTNKQLAGTHVDFRKLFSEKLEERKHFKFLLGKYKRQKRIISIGDQNKIWKKQKEKTRPILKGWADERKKARDAAIKKYNEQKAAELVKIGRLRYWLNQMGFRRRKPQREVTITETIQQEDDSSGGNDSSFDAIDTANQAYGMFQRGKNFVNTIRNLMGNGGAASGAEAAASSATGAGGGGIAAFFASPAGWITIAGIILAIIIILVVLIANGKFPTTTTQPGQSQCPQNIPSAPQMLTVLEQQFNITINGTDTNMIGDMYTTICTLSKYSFVQLLHVPQVKIDIYLDVPDKYHSACSGHTNQKNDAYRVDIYGACASTAGNEFVLTHELTHVIQFENTDLVSQFCSQVYRGSIRSGHCTASRPSTIPTYNCLRDYTPTVDTPNPAECFSDMAGSFLTYKDFHDTIRQGGQIVPNNWQLMNDYPGNFPIYYNFALLNLFAANTAIGNSSQLVSIAQQITQRLGKTFGRSIDLYDQIVPNPPGHFQLPDSPSPNYVVAMRSGSACIVVNHVKECVNSRYWCTDLIIDTYNISLGQRMLGEDLGSVEDLIYFWKNPPSSDFVFVHYRNASEHQSALIKLYATKPTFGAALFFESKEGDYNGFEHVALIRDMSLDSSGNGKILTYEANSGSTTGTYPINNWQIKNTPYPVTGFGLYIGIPGNGLGGSF